MKAEEGFLEKQRKFRKDKKKHNQRQYFDDDEPQHRSAGKKGHSKMRPIKELETGLYDIILHPEDYEDEPYADFVDIKLIK